MKIVKRKLLLESEIMYSRKPLLYKILQEGLGGIRDILIDGSIITAKIKVTSKDLDMYILNGIIVSESHVIKYNNEWIHVRLFTFI